MRRECPRLHLGRCARDLPRAADPQSLSLLANPQSPSWRQRQREPPSTLVGEARARALLGDAALPDDRRLQRRALESSGAHLSLRRDLSRRLPAGEFEAVELRAFEQVLEARGRSPFSGARLAEKAAELRRAVAGERKSYSEAEVTRMVNQNSQNKAAGAAPQLTARQKLAQRAGVGSGHVAVARPMQMQYDRFGRAIVQEQQGS